MHRQGTFDLEALLASHDQAARRAAHALPTVALTEDIQPAQGWLSGWEGSDTTVTSVTIGYGAPCSDGPRVFVMTARWAGTRAMSGSPRWLVEHHMRLDGHWFSSVDWEECESTIVVDGESRPGHLVRAGHLWWAARCAAGDLEITVVARDWDPETVSVCTVADPDSLLTRSQTGQVSQLPRSFSVPESEIPAELACRDPLRVFVDVNLRVDEEQVRWWAEGGPPPSFPPYLGALRRMAIRRHAELTDQPGRLAERAVDGIVSHLGSLHHNAVWFRESPRLRERAISETLIFATGLRESVSSQYAQRAWYRKTDSPLPVCPADAPVFTDATSDWLGEWAIWAARHAME